MSRDPVVMPPPGSVAARRAWARTKRATAPTSFGRTVIRSRLLDDFRRAPAATPGGCRWRARPHREIWPDARVASAIIGVAPSSPRPISRPRRGDRDGGVRIDQHPGAAIGLGDRVERHQRRRPGGRRTSRARRARPARRRATRRCRGNCCIAAATAAPLRPFSSNSRRSKLLDDLDVHARAEARLDRRRAPSRRSRDSARGCRCVGADDQPLDRQAERARDVAGIDIAEIAGRHAERHRPAPARRAPAPAAM